MKQDLDSIFCKSAFENYYTDVVQTDINGEYGIYSLDGVDMVRIAPFDNICSFSYFRQNGHERTKVLDSGGCTPDYIITAPYIFVYYNKDSVPVSNVTSTLKKSLLQFQELDRNYFFEIKSINSNKMDVLKNEMKNKSIENHVLFQDSTILAYSIEFTYVNAMVCDDVCI